MITFIILLATIIVAAVVSLILTIACGLGFVATFGDMFVFGLIVYMIIKIIRRNKK